MIFWRILDNQLYSVGNVDKLGFELSSNTYIPDEYLEKQEFMVMRTAHGIGDWGIISAMPRLLKQKYPNCKVYVPSEKMLEQLFSNYSDMWSSWNNPFKNVHYVFDNNPYVDGFKDYMIGEVFHDHYRIYDSDNLNVPLVEQMLKFWQFNENEYNDSQPELYWSDGERKFGNSIIDEYVGDNFNFGCLLTSNRYEKDRDEKKIIDVLTDNKFKYFYYTHIPIEDTPFNFIDKALDLRNVNPRIQMYIKSKAKLNVGNQSGITHLVVRYSDVYEVQRQFPLKHNFVKGEIYL